MLPGTAIPTPRSSRAIGLLKRGDMVARFSITPQVLHSKLEHEDHSNSCSASVDVIAPSVPSLKVTPHNL